ncbi:uncharacterized protein EAF01_007769 [Botrytis porri]|uniref:uncharacterized protein n=1 Tax=Botrytis porri TaxID=87229 RepID=UPI001901E4CA|nr:uncharacterized protein EAF01_007769 [Botrytis porri]KAF7900467.1 hypothetical protein EAF01_007769 [Botrytis porri]
MVSEATVRSLSLLAVEILDNGTLDQQTRSKEADDDMRTRHPLVNRLLVSIYQKSEYKCSKRRKVGSRAKEPVREVLRRYAGDHRLYGEREKCSHEYIIPSVEI